MKKRYLILAGILALFFLMFSVVGYTLETPEEELPEELLDLKNAAEEPAFSYGDTIVDMARKEYDYYQIGRASCRERV